MRTADELAATLRRNALRFDCPRRAAMLHRLADEVRHIRYTRIKDHSA